MDHLENFEMDNGEISKLSEKIKLLNQVRKEIEDKEYELKKLKDIEKGISGEDIPQFLSKFGIDSIKLDNGAQVTIEEKINVSLPKKDVIKRNNLMKWISENGGAGIIKDTLTMFDPENSIIEKVKELGVSFERKKDIHASTLKAFFKEILGLKKNTIQKVEISEIPKEANLYIYKETKIK